MSMSDSKRFEVLQRDGFRCVYCGREPEADNTTLEVDHVRPVSGGGGDEVWNLVASCRECNRGKAGHFWTFYRLPLTIKGRLRFDFDLDDSKPDFLFGYTRNAAHRCPKCDSIYTELSASLRDSMHVSIDCSDCLAVTRVYFNPDSCDRPFYEPVPPPTVH